MNVNFLNFYLVEQDADGSFFSGTIHIGLPDIGVDIRGIVVIMKNENWSFFLPNKMIDVDGKRVRYPVFSFSDVNKSKELLRIIIEKGKSFVMEKMSLL